MKKLHDIVTKKQWFILFNVGTILVLVITGRLTWSGRSLVASLLSLLVVNVVAAISSRNFPEWK